MDEVAQVFHQQVCPYLLDRKWRDTHSTAAAAAGGVGAIGNESAKIEQQ